MATKQHCDRCDAVICYDARNLPRQAAEITGSFLTDHAITELSGPVCVTAELTTFDGDCWNRVELCAPCFEAAMDEFARLRREKAVA